MGSPVMWRSPELRTLSGDHACMEASPTSFYAQARSRLRVDPTLTRTLPRSGDRS
ncbi:hypothetical protein J0895_12255 [Phormidium pseudopriestleyi FRX01]|uniref:Uncharacterized protein n=1 Tax=Phormidium pseudopriestleyi FRX01 TaxID=1759528 RepID=A0ABS3FTE3_9CYAN|nr:hypothetical protein [Phormidium pseudopriestleyi]MBO0349871.1 hypothetical protein [Phormidium pseudopriestleyi FRX01]